MTAADHGLSRRAALDGLALALAASLLPTLARAADKPSTIRIGSTAPGHLKFVLGQYLGWFKDEFAKDHIGVDFITFSGGGSEATTALATGAIDIAYTGSNPALRIASANVGVKLIGLSSYVPAGASSIIVAKNSPIRRLEDIKGKRVAYLAGTVRNSDLAKALKTVGLTIKDIQSFNMPFEASGPALTRGDIDAIVETSNTAAVLVDKGVARVLVDGDQHPEWSTPNVISVNGRFLAKYPDLVKRFLAVDLRISQWADNHFDETIKAFVVATKSSEPATRALYPNHLFYQDPRLTKAAIDSLKSEADFMNSAGLMNGPVDFTSWVDAAIVNEVYAESASRANQDNAGR